MEGREASWQRIHERLRHYRRLRPSFADMIVRRFYHCLYQRGICRNTGLLPLDALADAESNRPAPPTDRAELELWNQSVLELCEEHLDPQQAILQLQQAQKRDAIRQLIRVGEAGTTQFGALRRVIRRFCWIPRGEALFSPQEETGARASLIRNLLSDHLPFVQRARHVLSVRRFGKLIRRILGPDEGMGRLGGSISALVFLQALADLPGPVARPSLELRLPEGSFLRSDVQKRFLAENQLEEYLYFHYTPPELTRILQPILRRTILAGRFAPEMQETLLRFLREQRGKALRLFPSGPEHPGQESLTLADPTVISGRAGEERRLSLLTERIKQLYAESFSPDERQLREQRGTEDCPDRLAVFLAVAPGREYAQGFLPAAELILEIAGDGQHNWRLQAGGLPLGEKLSSQVHPAPLQPLVGGSGELSDVQAADEPLPPGFFRRSSQIFFDPATHPLAAVLAEHADLLHDRIFPFTPGGAVLRMACSAHQLLLLEALFR